MLNDTFKLLLKTLLKELFTNKGEILSCKSVKPCKNRKNSRAYYVRTRDKSGSNSPPLQGNVQISPSPGTMYSQMPGVCRGRMLKVRIDRRINCDGARVFQNRKSGHKRSFKSKGWKNTTHMERYHDSLKCSLAQLLTIFSSFNTEMRQVSIGIALGTSKWDHARKTHTKNFYCPYDLNSLVATFAL